MKLKIIYILSLLLIIVSQHTYGQSFVPQNLGPAINSSYDDINPVISPDGRILFFTRVNHPENTYGERDSEDIWVSYLGVDNKWSTAERLSELNIGRYNAVLSISADGQTLLLNGIFNKKGNIWKKRGLSISTKSGNTWSTPEKLKINKLSKKNRGMKSSASMSTDGQFIVLSFTKWYNGEHSNLFISQKKDNGKWKKPKKLKSLQSPRNEDSPFLSADNKTIYFSSNIESKKDYNIYKASRTGAGWKRWTYPVKLSDTINSPLWESYFKTNTKGSVAYFSSTNKSTGGKADIFNVKLFEENPFVIVSGSVINSKTSKLLRDKLFTILINGQPVDSVSINTDSSTYRVKLPLGASYTLAASVKNYTSQILAVDVSTVKEFTKMKIDLQVDPQSYVVVSGKIFVKGTDTPVPASANPTVLIDGQPANLLSKDNATGDYSIKISHGKTYNISVQANGYTTLPGKLDLSAIDEYQEIKKDLFVDEHKMALVMGKIIDKKSGKVVTYTPALKILVEGISTASSFIDPASEYELKLPLGYSYTISASAPNYYPVYEMINVSNESGNVKIFKDLYIVPIEVGQSIRLNNIFFETGKSILKKESFPELDRVIEFLATSPDIKIEIAGHTDNVGNAASNLKLSMARAKSVAAYIINKGIDKERITANGYGLSKPVASNKTAAGKAQNRRVEFTILDK
jgi:outer membrane protein OmpA-like peptidoglycan-associated protein